MTAGRPSKYTAKIADEICKDIADGKSVREIAASDDMPAMSTIFRWLSEHEDFQEQYTRAKEAQAEYMAEDILNIADDATNDWMERNGEENEGWQANGEHIQRSRLRIESRKWLLGKLKPKKYGDKQTLEHSGPDGKPIQTENKTEITAADKLAGFLDGIAERSGTASEPSAD